MISDTRICCVCKVEKVLEDFPNHKRYPKGKHYRCKLCNAELCRQKYSKNPEKERARVAAYRKGNKEYNRAICNRRRVRKLGNGGKHTMAEWKALKEQFGNMCIACGKSNCTLTRDHIIPLTKGGTDNIENIQPLCQSCNSKKRTRATDYRAALYMTSR